MPGIPSIAPLSDADAAPFDELLSQAKRIDGWGPRAWAECLGHWRFPHGGTLILDAGPGPMEQGRILAWLLIEPGFRAAGCADSDADWLLREAKSLRGGAASWHIHETSGRVMPTTACFHLGNHRFALRCDGVVPFTGMCVDGNTLAGELRKLAAWAARMARGPWRSLARHRRSVLRQRALRDALSAHGLVAFIGDGARIARTSDDRIIARSTPFRAPASLAMTLDLGRFGRVRGMGIKQGVTALIGAPYHGKSTLLSAIRDGMHDHAPGDGRELVATTAACLSVLADDGRPIFDQDLSPCFRHLPGGDPKQFTTVRASGATSMAAGVLQGVAAGARLLLIDEDTAAGNFLHLDPRLAQLLGPSARGYTPLADLLPLLAGNGVSTILVVGSSAATLQDADRVVKLTEYRPSDITARVRRPRNRMLRRLAIAPRMYHAGPDALFGIRHFIEVDASESERPRLRDPTTGAWTTCDLRRIGFALTPSLTRGAIAGAGWACRLAGDTPISMDALGERWRAWLSEHGPAALDPFHDGIHTVPPWPLVAAIMERLPQLHVRRMRRSAR